MAYTTDEARGVMRLSHFQLEVRVSASDRSRKHDLECLRFQTDCKRLAVEASNPTLRSHFGRMAAVWGALANSESSGTAPDSPVLN